MTPVRYLETAGVRGVGPLAVASGPTSATTTFSIPIEVVEDDRVSSWILAFVAGELAGLTPVDSLDTDPQWVVSPQVLVGFLIGDIPYHELLRTSDLRMPLQLLYFFGGYLARPAVRRHFRRHLLGETGSEVPADNAAAPGQTAPACVAPTSVSGAHDLVEWIREIVADRDLATGIQLYVSKDGDTLIDLALGTDGLGRSIQPDSLPLVRCALAKPVLAIEVASLVSSGELSYETTVGDVLSGASGFVSGLSVDELLTHRAGMYELTGAFLSVLDPDHRLSSVLRAGPPAAFERHANVAYADGGGAVLIAAMLERITGLDYEKIFATRLDPDGQLSQNIQFRPTGVDYERIVIDSWIQSDFPVPYHIEETPEYVAEWNPGWGGYASARGLGLLYERVLDTLHGRPSLGRLDPATASEMLADRWVPSNVDSAYRNDPTAIFSFSRGFCHGFADYGVPEERRPHVFGHSGQGAAIAMADAGSGLVISCKFFGQINEARHFSARGSRLVGEIFALTS